MSLLVKAKIEVDVVAESLRMMKGSSPLAFQGPQCVCYAAKMVSQTLPCSRVVLRGWPRPNLYSSGKSASSFVERRLDYHLTLHKIIVGSVSAIPRSTAC